MRSPQTAPKSNWLSATRKSLHKATVYIFFFKSKLLGPERAATRVRLCQVLSWRIEHVREEHI